jgi:hypothetical protein
LTAATTLPVTTEFSPTMNGLPEGWSGIVQSAVKLNTPSSVWVARVSDVMAASGYVAVAPPANLTWTTYEGYFTITNNAGTTAETIKPVFELPTNVSIT